MTITSFLEKYILRMVMFKHWNFLLLVLVIVNSDENAGSEDEILIEVGRDCCIFTNVFVSGEHEFLIATLITRG